MKNKNKNQNLMVEFLQIMAQAVADKEYFGTRKHFIEEFITFLKNPKTPIAISFNERISQIKKRYRIPHLRPHEDIKDFPIGDAIDAESVWLHSQKNKDKMISDINAILNDYNLPRNFFDWVQYRLLYNKTPPWVPVYNWDLPFQIDDNPNELKRMLVTSREVQYLKSFFRRRLGIKRRPPKKSLIIYKHICEIIDKAPKNKMRSFRIMATALKTLERGELIKNKPEFSQYEGQILKHNPQKKAEEIIERYRLLSGRISLLEQMETRKKTYADIVVNEFPDDDFSNDKKRNQWLRKQNQRLRERFSKIMVRKKLKN